MDVCKPALALVPTNGGSRGRLQLTQLSKCSAGRVCQQNTQLLRTWQALSPCIQWHCTQQRPPNQLPGMAIPAHLCCLDLILNAAPPALPVRRGRLKLLLLLSQLACCQQHSSTTGAAGRGSYTLSWRHHGMRVRFVRLQQSNAGLLPQAQPQLLIAECRLLQSFITGPPLQPPRSPHPCSVCASLSCHSSSRSCSRRCHWRVLSDRASSAWR
jgi:hypothetical protein